MRLTTGLMLAGLNQFLIEIRLFINRDVTSATFGSMYKIIKDESMGLSLYKKRELKCFLSLLSKILGSTKYR